MSGSSTDRRERFARNWKLVGVSSKSKWQGSLLNNRILSKTISRLVDKFQDQTIPVIEDACYELGREDANQLSKTLNLKDDFSRSCLAPIEMICLLNGIDADIISEKKHTSSMKISECPFSDVLVGVVPDTLVCKNYFRGMAQAVNKNAKMLQPHRKCKEEGHCEFVITISI